MYNYSTQVKEAVKDYFKENFNQDLTDDQVNKMEPECVLDAYMEWEGIIGYTGIILSILNQ